MRDKITEILNLIKINKSTNKINIILFHCNLYRYARLPGLQQIAEKRFYKFKMEIALLLSTDPSICTSILQNEEL